MTTDLLSSGTLVSAHETARAGLDLGLLSGQQRLLYEALVDLDATASIARSRTAEMYLGVVMLRRRAEWDDNPDIHAFAAHGLRELMEKLPRSLDVPVAQGAGMTDRVRTLTRAWEKFESAAEPKREARLRKFLDATKAFAMWFNAQHTSRTQRAGRIIDRLDPRGMTLPAPIKDAHADIWNECHRYFENVSHHREEDLESFDAYLDTLEQFLLDRLRPRTYEDQEALKALIAEAEGHA